MHDTLLSIARCKNFITPMAQSGPCTKVISAQDTLVPGARQIPEPWRGDIASAPLLFISSNPSYDLADDSPTESFDDENLHRYYTEGFPACFPRIRLADGTSSKNFVRFWASIRARAAELYRVDGKTLVPGKDFAITEVVHCKSRNEYGVREALAECIKQHWAPMMQSAAATVVVVLGDTARQALDLRPDVMPWHGEWHGRVRHLIWLPHPNARKPRSFDKLYTAAELESIRAELTHARRP